jgi:hypothetical protein
VSSGDKRVAKVGFDFPPGVVPNYAKPNEMVKIWPSQISPGVIAYDTDGDQRKRTGNESGGHSFLDILGGVGLGLSATALSVGTVAEDVGTGGLGVADDVPSFAAAGAMFKEAYALIA